MQYRVLSTIRLNGKEVAPGAIIDLNDNDARQLLAVDAVEKANKPFQKDIKTPWGDTL